MAGLLGDMSDPQGMANLALAAGLLSPGSFGQGLGRGLQGYQGTLANAQDMQIKQQQMQAAKLLYDKQVQQMDILRPVLQRLQGAQGGAAPQQAAPAPMSQSAMFSPEMNAQRQGMPQTPMQGQAPQPQSQGGGVNFPLSFGDVTALKLGGLPDLTADYKMALEGVSHAPGSEVTDVNGNRRIIPVLDKGQQLGADGAIGNIPGYVKSAAELTAANKSAETAAVNAQTPLTPQQIDAFGGSALVGKTTADLLNAGKVPASFSPRERFAIAADVQRSGTPQFTANGQSGSLSASGAGGYKSAADLAAEAEKAKALAVQPINFATKVNNDAHTNNQKTMGDLADVTNNESEIVARNARIQPFIAKLDKAGGFAYDERVNLANDLKNSGIPGADTLSKLVLTGNPADAKTVQNQLAAAAIQTMLDTLNKEGKPNRAIFNAVEAQKEALASGKDVLSNVMDLQKQLYDQHVTQLGGMTDLMSSPNYNPVKFQYQFATQKQNTISAPAAAPAPTTFKMLPAASQYTGKRMKSDDGTIYRSDGKTWTKE